MGIDLGITGNCYRYNNKKFQIIDMRFGEKVTTVITYSNGERAIYDDVDMTCWEQIPYREFIDKK